MTLTISLDDSALAALDASAAFRQISREETVREAVLRLAEYDAWFRSEVEKGLSDIEAGRVIPAEEADAEVDAFLSSIN